MLTNNEKKALRFVLTSFDSDYSINEIAKQCNLSPNGAYKLLKKFEDEGVLMHKKIANIKSYKINFESDKAFSLLGLALIPEIDKKRLLCRIEDLKQLKAITKACIIFGSYITDKREPKDIDILFILDKNGFKKYKRIISEIKDIIPVRVHDVIQTEEDLKSNIINKSPIVLEALRNGLIIWGQHIITDVIKDVS